MGEYQSLVGETQHHPAGLKQRTKRQGWCLGGKVCQKERRYLICTLISVLTSSPMLRYVTRFYFIFIFKPLGALANGNW